MDALSLIALSHLYVWTRTFLSYVSPLCAAFLVFLFFRDLFAFLPPAGPNPLLSLASTHVEIVQHMEGDFQRVSGITTLYSNPSRTIMDRG